MKDLFVKKIGAQLKKVIKPLQKTFKRLTNVKKIVSKFFRAAFSKIRSFLSRPGSVQDYIKIGTTYIAKLAIVVVTLVVFALLFILNWFILPWAEGNLWIPEIVINTARFHSYSGSARVVTEDMNLIYEGELQEGRITGKGILYDKDGFLIYQGDFLKENYHGTGDRYARDGRLIYSGEFKDNLYHGRGKLYGNPRLIYEGEFHSGEFHGKGNLYDGNKLLYEGQFQTGDYHGEGRLFENKRLLYEGEFQDNMFHGGGTKYHDNGVLRYSGNFALGEKEGEGKLYNRDGQLMYHGFFLDGLYDGAGIKYDEDTGRTAYEGQFRRGDYHGLGSLYDLELGRLKYDGNFKEGRYSGQGSLYNWKGQNIYDGYFYQGEIDYFRYIDRTIEKVREEFGEEDKAISFGDTLIIAYNELQVLFTFKYQDEEDVNNWEDKTNECNDTGDTGEASENNEDNEISEDNDESNESNEIKGNKGNNDIDENNDQEGEWEQKGEDDENLMLKKIIFLGDQVIMGGHTGMPIKELTEVFDENYSDFYHRVDEEKKIILPMAGVVDNIKELYSVKFSLRDEVFIRFYSLEFLGEVLYFEMGSLEDKDITNGIPK